MQMGMHVLAPEAFTCVMTDSSSTIDMFLTDSPMALACVGVPHVNYAVKVAVHRAVDIVFAAQHTKQKVNVLSRPG